MVRHCGPGDCFLRPHSWEAERASKAMNIVTIHWMEYVVEFVAPRGRKKSILSNYVVSSTSGGRLASSEGNWMAKEKYSCAPIIKSALV